MKRRLNIAGISTIILLGISYLCNCVSCSSAHNPEPEDGEPLNSDDGGFSPDDDNKTDGGDGYNETGDIANTECEVVLVPDGVELIDTAAIKGYIKSFSGTNYTTPVFDISNCDMHIAWMDFLEKSLYYRKSFNMGSTWEDARKLVVSDDLTESDVMPKVFSQDEFVYVVWPMKMPPKLFFLSSSDGGSTWGEPKEIGSIWHSTHLSLTADSNGFVAIIATARTGSLDEGVWLYRSDDFGASWRNPEKIFELGAHTISTDLIKSDGTLHLVWYDLYDPGLNPTLEIFYRNSGDNGDSWNSSVLINDRKEVGAVPSYIGDINPAVDVYKNRIDVSWSECPLSNDSTNDKYLFHRSGDQSGANWGTVTKLDPTLDNGGKPLVKDISSSSSYVHLVSNLGYYLHDINANTWSQQFTARGGRMIDDSEGWVVIVGRDENGMYWIRFPEGQ